MKHRINQLTTWLKEEKTDVAFITSKENIFYLTNFYTDPHERLVGLFVFKGHSPIMVVPSMEVSQVQDAGWEHQIVGYKDHESPWGLIQQLLKGRQLDTVSTAAIETDVLTVARMNELLHLFPNAALLPVEDQLNSMRVVKDASEIEIIQRAAEMADYGVEIGKNALKEGITEMEVLAKIEYELKKKGIREMSFSTMVLFGEKSGAPHGNPGDRMLQEGDFVLFDLGVVLDGYTSDITRTFAFRSISDEKRKLYNTVLQAQLASLEISKPGTRIGDLDQTARDVITEAGYGDRFPHRIGHGMGINVHEFPSMSHLNDGILKEGMVYTIEPGIYDPVLGGVRIEDDVLITKDGHITLTKTPKELTIV
ncbi:putative Xaa-Pro dipeptidase [Alkalihalophilus pseudofirmus OF4]|uniref:Xaa-Pro dipeptidase n=1 Tax=Alkalihalophilus pseudofirmus (strain ATCC BAA-2126 / JCM 17055 / OF4) TaxID=398511 RepID=D3FZU2_ALKPO|nr:Xaa-Pro peptidase family protein [Alkalihalophilus pseudofirmus]ADC51027.1 putative Xaa-Pro dipeptidase [Alkalihalophilus pseudofirmus OF4]